MTIMGISVIIAYVFNSVMYSTHMVDKGWVRTNTNTWQASRWPLPKPATVRSNAALYDTQGRTYVRMSKANAALLGINSNTSWWWYALPVPSRRSERVGQPLAVGDRVQFLSGHRRRVRGIGWAVERNRAVGIIDMT